MKLSPMQPQTPLLRELRWQWASPWWEGHSSSQKTLHEAHHGPSLGGSPETRLSAPPLSGGSSSEGTVGDLWKIPPSVPQGRWGVWGRRPGGQALRLHTGEADGLPAPGLQGGSLAFRVALPAGQRATWELQPQPADSREAGSSQHCLEL